MTFRKYLVLAGVTLFAASGDSLLSVGMKRIGSISASRLGDMVLAFLNPWVAVGILLLLAFFACYMTALSWADLTFVMPATAFGYVVVALLSRFWLHEHLSVYRWIGILLITSAVGFVANSPSRTEHPGEAPHELPLMDSGVGR